MNFGCKLFLFKKLLIIHRDAHFPTGNRETGNRVPGNFPREMGDREKSGNREKNSNNFGQKLAKNYIILPVLGLEITYKTNSNLNFYLERN